MLKGKRILITAGPTWVPIDRVRVISNISSGLTGIVIANQAAKLGADITLLLGQITTDHRLSTIDHRLKIIRFKYFDELLTLLRQELKKHKYDAVIHSAAVSDYRPIKIFRGKLKSGKRALTISLKPAIKIIEVIRKYAPMAFLVMFKLEINMPKRQLVAAAYKSMRHSKADLIVANNLNEITENKHKGYIIDINKNIIEVSTKKELAERLFRLISERF